MLQLVAREALQMTCTCMQTSDWWKCSVYVCNTYYFSRIFCSCFHKTEVITCTVSDRAVIVSVVIYESVVLEHWFFILHAAACDVFVSFLIATSGSNVSISLYVCNFFRKIPRIIRYSRVYDVINS